MPTLGIEPNSLALQASATTSLAQSANILVDAERIELSILQCKSSVFPLALRAHIFNYRARLVFRARFWGDRRDSNAHDRDHNPAPKPFGHGHTFGAPAEIRTLFCRIQAGGISCYASSAQPLELSARIELATSCLPSRCSSLRATTASSIKQILLPRRFCLTMLSQNSARRMQGDRFGTPR